jgi:glycosyltransferase involved in cell wall biosynthesis
VIRALNPDAKIVLHLHAEWFSQNRPAVLERRLRHVDLVTAVSDHITRKTRRQFPVIAARCETMYNGIDAAEFSRERNYSEARTRKKKRILYAGAVSPHKGLHVLLDAFSMVANQYPEVRLDIVGLQGSYPLAECFDLEERELIKSISPFYAQNRMSRLKAKLSLAPRDAGTYLSYLKGLVPADMSCKIALLGFVPRPKLLDLYYGADVFAFPPIWDEGFGIPPVEAMAAGLPVVASRSGAIAETVKDGQSGFLVNKNDARALAEALLKLLRDDNLREAMGRASRRWAHEQFTWDKVAERMYKRYSDLCGIGAAESLCV